MIKNMKIGLKSLRYAYGIKSNLLMLVFFFAAGIILSGRDSDTTLGVYGNLLLMCTAMVPAQLIFSLSASNMVLASPLRKRMQTSIPATLTCGNMMLVYLVMAAYRLIRVWGNPQLAGILSGELVVAAGIAVVFMIYLGIAYKYFMASMLLVLVIVLVYPYKNGWQGEPFCLELFGQGAGGVALTVLLGMGIVALGGFLQYLVSLVFYRAPMAKMAQSAPLRREL